MWGDQDQEENFVCLVVLARLAHLCQSLSSEFQVVGAFFFSSSSLTEVDDDLLFLLELNIRQGKAGSDDDGSISIAALVRSAKEQEGT